MSRPDDIPKDIWENAENISIAYHHWLGVLPDDDHVLPTNIARAVMAAADEERETCAKVADERSAVCADAVAKIEAGELYQSFPRDAKITENCARMEASHIAKLIRQRRP